VRRLAALVAVAVAAAAVAGVARGDETGSTFSVVSGVFTLPGADVANETGIALPQALMSPPAQPEQLSWDQLVPIWQNAGQAYGVPWNVLAAINKIESNFGRNMGPSSAGAIGWMQFMPSTWLRWGTDADGNGIADPWNPVDAVYSAARYLAASGAAQDVRQSVFSYNHAWWYVNEVMQLAQLYSSSNAAAAAGTTSPGQTVDTSAAVSLEQLQAQLDQAKAQVTQLSQDYETALGKAQALADQESTLNDKATSTPLLSDRLDAQKAAVQLSFDVDQAQADADALKGKLDAAQAKLDDLQQQASNASFNQPARQLLSAAPAPAAGSGSYVFPVGGGPSVVSVSHSHHDYPAADIAAPEGSPEYALTNGTVLYSWDTDARCGTGFTMRAADGQVWTYCHMSYKYPEVVQGATLTAGQPVGLVGHTGDATGPHLHLQLQPATSYPQAQEWFTSFAGTAFSWSDGTPTKTGSAPASKIVFDIVQSPGR
jgi:murein DD-endopeptidase MepM/ murein hydrolase activator NlpD